jgi:hypothetical protein
MDKPKPDEHPIATAVGKALGTLAAKTGLAHAEKPKAKKRLPRKLKKSMKKAEAKGKAAK